MARGRSSSFSMSGAGLFGNPEIATQEVQEVHEVHDVPQVQEVHEEYEAQEVQYAQQVHEVQDVQVVHNVQVVHDVQEVQEPQCREYGTTQGKKGQHAKRINMAFSDDNHDFITRESRRQGMSATAFVNMIIDEYKKKKEIISK